jgi:hypothetical protein
MLTMTTTWIAVATAFVATAFISKELARRRGRDANFYFFVGLFLGPFAPLMILAPLPDHHGDKATGNQEKHIRFIKGTKCPRCHRQVPVRAEQCNRCGEPITTYWWERTDRPISTQP